jgi:hypothetical protein
MWGREAMSPSLLQSLSNILARITHVGVDTIGRLLCCDGHGDYGDAGPCARDLGATRNRE